MTSFLTALLTRVLCKNLASINVHNRFMIERDRERRDKRIGREGERKMTH